MRVGLVSPYSFDVPGGVQFHIRDLAGSLIERGHEVSVLAPADEATELPDYVTALGKAIPVTYNGSVARLAFGPVVAHRSARWLKEGDFDVVHIHEPAVPSVSLIALHQASTIVATFHSSQLRSKALIVANPLLQPALERISARIAVSEDARRTLVEHLGGDAVVIPNGVHVPRFEQGSARPEWQGSAQRPTFAFLGRLDESRKGLPVLLGALRRLRQECPGARLLVAGRGDIAAALRHAGLPSDAVEPLGEISEEDKIALLASVDVYVAPQTGGESFGIVLVEAMSAGAAVVASDLNAFRAVLEEGTCGRLFRVGDSDHLAQMLIAAVRDPEATDTLRRSARRAVRRYDWSTVTTMILDVYAMVAQGDSAVTRSLWQRLRGHG